MVELCVSCLREREQVAVCVVASFAKRVPVVAVAVVRTASFFPTLPVKQKRWELLM